jgi:hypothetical protein
VGWPTPADDDGQWLAPRAGRAVVPAREAPIVVAASTPARRRGRPAPDLEGVVENVQQVQMPVEIGCLAGAARGVLGLLMLAFKPLLVLAGWLFGGGRQQEMQTVYILTVTRPDGTVAQARMEGECRGALPALGHPVSLWGSWRHGVLAVRTGFNHFVNADIVLRKRRDWASLGCGLLLAAILFLFLFAALASVLQDSRR